MSAEWRHLTTDELHILMDKQEAERAERVSKYGKGLGDALQNALEAEEAMRRMPGSDLHQMVLQRRRVDFGYALASVASHGTDSWERSVNAFVEYMSVVDGFNTTNSPHISHRALEGGE